MTKQHHLTSHGHFVDPDLYFTGELPAVLEQCAHIKSEIEKNSSRLNEFAPLSEENLRFYRVEADQARMALELRQTQQRLTDLLQWVSGLAQLETQPRNVSEYIDKHRLSEVIAYVTRLAKEIIGDQVESEPRLSFDRDTGKANLVLAVRYNLPSGTDMKAISDKHRALLRRYTSDVTEDAQQRMTLLRLP